MKKFIISLFILCMTNLPLHAQNNNLKFTFEKNLLKLEPKSGYTQITYSNFEITRTVGAPQLPVKIVQVAIPPGMELDKINYINISSEFLKGTFNPYPVQSPRVLSDKSSEFTAPVQKYYTSTEMFPKSVVAKAPTGSFSGNNIASLLIYPVQYFAAEKKLQFISEIEIELVLKQSTKETSVSRRTAYSENLINNSLKNIIDREKIQTRAMLKTSLDQEQHTYVIITTTQFEESLKPLLDWKNKKGLSAKMVTTSEIYQNYSGADNQEKIRNFIKHAYQNWGTIWVLLGGDTQYVPVRKAFAFDCEYGDFEDNYIPCDLYYSDLDGDWNANGNDIYGEVDDNIDMYPDVFVGRASAGTTTEMATFVNKLLSYEKNGVNGHELDMLFLAEILWMDPYTNSGEGKDLIDELFVPDRFNIKKLYQHNENENQTTVIDALNRGYNIINHDGHANTSIMGIGDGFLGSNMVDGLTNSPVYSILFSIGCWPAAFDDDCIAEHFITAKNGGGVAFIGNSRYGWGSPGNPHYGYSDRFDQQFFRYLLDDSDSHLGSALAAAKREYVPYAAEENVYRWCEYEINLLGDPEMSAWTDAPKTFVIDSPDSLPAGNSRCDILVTDGAEPVKDALVCLMQSDGVYQTAITGIDGLAQFIFCATNIAEEIQLTVTAHNFLPHESSISLTTENPYVQISSFQTNGSTEGYISPDKLIQMDCWFKNYGSQTATETKIQITTDHTKIALINSLESIKSLQPGDSILVENAFTFNADAALKNGDVIQFNAKISDLADTAWEQPITVTVATPILSYLYHVVNDSSKGDKDGFAEPGETVQATMFIQNNGLCSAKNLFINFKNKDPNTILPTLIENSGDIEANDILEVPFKITVDAGCNAIYFAPNAFSIGCSEGYNFDDTLTISIGELGLQDDMELNNDNWTHQGAIDLWNLSLERKHSKNFSWYCGHGDKNEYDNMMDNELVSRSFTVDHNSELSFWCWYQVPNYGVNGIYPEINNGSGWKTLDFIGSGGALNFLPTGNDWLEYVYDLSEYEAGEQLQLRFRFVSDNEAVEEGVYIDDVVIKNKHQKSSIVIPLKPAVPALTIEENNADITLSWDSDYQEIEDFDNNGYKFQGYNIYQFYSKSTAKSNGKCIATFDIIDGVTTIVEEIIDPATGEPKEIIQQRGSDSGIQRSFVFDTDYLMNYHLVKGKPYYFAISAYAYNESASPKCVESKIQIIEITYKENASGYAYGDTLNTRQTTGDGNGKVRLIVFDVDAFTGHNYQVDFKSNADTNTVWSLTDKTLDKTLLENQKISNNLAEIPIVDGFQIIVDQPELETFSKITKKGSGMYSIDFSIRATRVFPNGSSNLFELEKDYEFRYTGEFSEPDANQIVHVMEGTGSLATLYKTANFELKNHPMNPNPGSDAPFMVRIPFEVWNIDDSTQVNLLLADLSQEPGNNPFHAFPELYAQVTILNTPYKEEVADIRSDEMQHLTWNLWFFDTNGHLGDVITVTYDNTIKDGDAFSFKTRRPTDITDKENMLDNFIVYQNYPNPFNPETAISFQLPQNDNVKLVIYDILGREVQTLINQKMRSGVHSIIWKGKNSLGQSVASGIYFYSLETSEHNVVNKMLLIR